MKPRKLENFQPVPARDTFGQQAKRPTNSAPGLRRRPLPPPIDDAPLLDISACLDVLEMKLGALLFNYEADCAAVGEVMAESREALVLAQNENLLRELLEGEMKTYLQQTAETLNQTFPGAPDFQAWVDDQKARRKLDELEVQIKRLLRDLAEIGKKVDELMRWRNSYEAAREQFSTMTLTEWCRLNPEACREQYPEWPQELRPAA